MLIGLAVGAAIGAGIAIRHFCWPWERPVVIYRPEPRPIVIERAEAPQK